MFSTQTLVHPDTKKEFEVLMYQEKYPVNDRIAVLLRMSGTGEPFGVLTVNIPDAKIRNDEICVKTWSENEWWYSQLLNTRYFCDTGKRVPCGFAVAEIWNILPG